MDMSPLVTFLRAVGGGTFVCLAIFLARCSGTMTGKAVGIMFPISTYIICGFEHCLASMFFVYTAKMNGLGAAYGWKKILGLLLPGTIGNFVGGALLVGCGMASIPTSMSSSSSSSRNKSKSKGE